MLPWPLYNAKIFRGASLPEPPTGAPPLDPAIAAAIVAPCIGVSAGRKVTFCVFARFIAPLHVFWQFSARFLKKLSGNPAKYAR